jgi:type II secretory pathway component PulF
MLYHYSAIAISGELTEGDFDADNLEQALEYLKGKGLRPISVSPIKPIKEGGFASWFGGISISDKVFLTKYLALMLRVGTDLLSAINILIADFEKPSVKNFLLEVRENLSKGQPFYKAFAEHPHTFSPVFISLVKAAETSGNLQETFEQLSVSTQREADMQGNIRAALIYPVVLLVLATAIMLFLVTFALPKVANVFSSGGINPPAFSEIVFTVGLFIGNNIWTIAAVIIVVVGGLFYFFNKTETGKRQFDRIIMAIPVVSQIYREIAIQRMASTMSSLMKAGLPIMQTIGITADTVGLREYRYALLRIANEGLAKGFTIGDAFRRETVFPKTVSNLVAISEKAGHLDEVLDTLANFYEGNIESSLKSATALIEPIMLLGMGLMVAIIALAIIVPVYQLTTSF